MIIFVGGGSREFELDGVMQLAIMDRIKRFRDNYVINQVKKATFPDFETDTIKRYRIVFSSRVQRVGFRLEVLELAKRLNLTGFCKNLEDGKVLVELQGASNKIDYLLSFMESLKRIKISDKTIEALETKRSETEFLKL